MLERRAFLKLPVEDSSPVPAEQKELSEADWNNLLYLGHVDKAAAFQRYSQYYLSTSGQIYWSDTHQMSVYIDDYHKSLDEKLGVPDAATEIITEIYVSRTNLAEFMADVRSYFRENRVDLIYGTTRLIEKDDESFLAWAQQSYACIIFNLHTVHTEEGIERSAAAFRQLIDLAIRYGGSYYLTYHKFATRQQVLTCYPQFPEFPSSSTIPKRPFRVTPVLSGNVRVAC